MPTKKPVIQTVLDEEEYLKFLGICEKEVRTKSQLGKIAIQQFIKNYESQNGNITTGDISITGESNSVNIGHSQM